MTVPTVPQTGPMEAWAKEHQECFTSTDRAGWWGAALQFAREQDAIRADLLAALEHQVSAEMVGACALDHHGFCQAHWLEQPCSVAAARDLIARARGEAA